MNNPNTDHLKEMFRVIKWVLQTPNIGLKMSPQVVRDDLGQIIWKVHGICDATWGSDPDDGRSITGYALMFMEVPIIWKSKTQQSVVLSSAEAEYISSTELVKEVLWITQILEFLQMTVTIPVPIYIDNISAIHMVRNNISTTNTRHMNIKHHFVREMHESGIVEYLYV